METTLGQFLNSLPRDTFFVSEAEPDGTRSYYPIEDLEAVPGDDPIWANEVVVQWMDSDTALMCNIKADGLCTMIVSKHHVFVTPPHRGRVLVRQPSYLFPLASIDAIMN